MAQTSWVIKNLGWQGSSPESRTGIQRYSSRISKNFVGHQAKRSFEKIPLSAFGGTGQKCASSWEKENASYSIRAPSIRLCLDVFLGFSTSVLIFWAREFFVVKSCSVYCKMFDVLPGFSPLHASNTLSLDHLKCHKWSHTTWPLVPSGGSGHCPWMRTTNLDW